MQDINLWTYDFNIKNYEISTKDVEEDCKKIKKSLNRFDEHYNAAKNLLDSPKLHMEASNIRTHILIMISRKEPAEAIDRYLDQALPRLSECVENYKAKNSSFSIFQESHNQIMNDTEQKISRALSASTPLMLPKSNNSSPQEFLQRLPGYWEQRSDNMAFMQVTNGLAAVVGYVGDGIHGIANEFGSNVQRQARVICNSNPLIQKRCGQIKNIPSSIASGITSLNDVLESTGKKVEKKVTSYCTKNDTNRNRCQVVLNISKGFGQAVQDSEPKLHTVPIKISLADISKNVAQGTRANDHFWMLKSGSSEAYLASMGTLFLSTNPFSKGSHILGKTAIKALPGKSAPVITNAVSSLNNSQYKTLKTLFSAQKTTPPGWNQIEQLFKSLGCEISEGAGSRITVSHNGIEKCFHVPHRHKQTEKYQLNIVRDYLKSIDAVPLEDGKWRLK